MADPHATARKPVAPAATGAFVRVNIPCVLVSLVPVTLTAAGSLERRFAWAFASAVFVAGVIACLAERCGRRAAGHCRQCNYDLTGNTTGVCPECGAACKAADPAGVSPAAGN